MGIHSVYLGISVVFPLIVYMLIGAILKKSGWLSDAILTKMNRVVFQIFLFALIFRNSYSLDLQSAFQKENMQLLLLALISVGVVFAGAAACCKLLAAKSPSMNKKRRAVIVQGIYRSNLALFGLPVSLAIYGEGNQGAIAILMTVMVPVYNIIAVILLSDASGQKVTPLQLVKQVISNPLVCSSILGMSFNMLGISLPEIVTDVVRVLSRTATPLAFIVLGGSLIFTNIKRDIKTVVCVCFIRLIIIPMAVIGIGIGLGMRNHAIVALLGAFASSTAVASYTMAKNNEIEPELAGELVAATTVCSVITMFGWITVLDYIGVI